VRRWIISGAAAAVAVMVMGLYWFQPWKLFTAKTVNEPVPSVRASDATSATATLVAQGDLITHEHATSGAAQLIRLADGGYQVILLNLSTSDGPDLRVWLTDQPVRTGSDGWRVFDDGRYVELGRLKGNRGTQAYTVPAGTDLTGLRSVTIWCKRFAVSFGAAELVRT
jgi:hypothetical protein